jgi:hypothetical protein
MILIILFIVKANGYFAKQYVTPQKTFFDTQ